MRSVEKQLKTVKHAAGHEIVVRGEGGVGFMVITDGTVSVKTIQGHTRKLGPGDSFGEMALLDHEGRSATITATTKAPMPPTPEGTSNRFLRKNPKAAYGLLQTWSRRTRRPAQTA